MIPGVGVAAGGVPDAWGDADIGEDVGAPAGWVSDPHAAANSIAARPIITISVRRIVKVIPSYSGVKVPVGCFMPTAVARTVLSGDSLNYLVLRPLCHGTNPACTADSSSWNHTSAMVCAYEGLSGV